jgi:hypothetical protein
MMSLLKLECSKRRICGRPGMTPFGRRVGSLIGVGGFAASGRNWIGADIDHDRGRTSSPTQSRPGFLAAEKKREETLCNAQAPEPLQAGRFFYDVESALAVESGCHGSRSPKNQGYLCIRRNAEDDEIRLDP